MNEEAPNAPLKWSQRELKPTQIQLAVRNRAVLTADLFFHLIQFSWRRLFCCILSCLYQFDRWSDSQRKAVLQDLVLSCSVEQLRFLSLSVSRQLPLQAADFTCLLPRAVSLYLFSFLDPRSLCRCAQVHVDSLMGSDVKFWPLFLWRSLVNEWFDPPCAGELAVEEHCGDGPAVDAQVSEARLAPQLLPDTIRTGRLEETLHPDSPGAERPAG